jgi:protein-arginine kinase activator protein McsA
LDKKTNDLHFGIMIDPQQCPPSNQISSLNAALNAALALEKYEQAASIRDQIKSLMGKAGNEAPPPPRQED